MCEHIVSVRSYVIVFLALLCLTALTTGVAFVDLGAQEHGDCAGDRCDENASGHADFHACEVQFAA